MLKMELDYQKNRKKVALYYPLGTKGANWSGLGGAEKRLTYLISHMNPDLFQISIVYRSYQDCTSVLSLLKQYLSEKCRVVFVRNDLEAFKHFANEKYDVVLYDDCMVRTIPGVLGACIAKSRRVLIFVTVNYSKWMFKRKWHSLIMSFNILLSNNIDCLYPSSKTKLTHISRKPVTVTPCSLPHIEEYINYNSKRENIIVFAARLVPEKNPMLLLHSVHIVQNLLRKHGFRVVICGDGYIKQEIEDKIKIYGLTDIVCCTGAINTKDMLLKARIFCSLQEEENYPSQSLLEAIASGCYCIATNVGDTRLIVKPSFGVLIEKTADELSNAISRAISFSDEQCSLIEQAAKCYARDHFMPANAIHHYEKICMDNR